MEPDDGTQASFWNERYAQGLTPWDFGGVPVRLARFLSKATPGRVYIPGCGRGHEVAAFAAAGWQVDAIDFSTEAVAVAQANLGDFASLVRQGDFFRDEGAGKFDVVYERTFLCALSPDRWQEYGRRIYRLLQDEGCLMGFFFFGREEDPPPYPLQAGQLEKLLEPAFTRTEDEAVTDSLPFFKGRERWQVWRKRSPNPASGDSPRGH